MSYLLDTNAVSEPGRRAPNRGFMDWYRSMDSADFFISAITLGELRRGIALIAPGERREGLDRLYGAVTQRFADQLLAVDARVAETWGDLSARLKRAGAVVGAADELIAATAIVHGLVLVTRNARHFESTGCQVLSPWSA